MAELRETTLDHVSGEDFMTFFSSEQKWLNVIKRLREQYPDDVEIRHVNDDGSLIARIPASWVKLKPKKKVNMSAEQIAASKARLEQGRMKRLQRTGDDSVRTVTGKDTG